MILIDSSIWLESSRRDAGAIRVELDELLAKDSVATTEVIIAEVLQGAKTEAEFSEWQEVLGALHFYPADLPIWEKAARLAFDLRRRGQQTAISDLVVATVAMENDFAVYTQDTDFARIPGLKLHEPQNT